MKKKCLFFLLFNIGFILSYAQTFEDIKQLGLTNSQLITSLEKRQIVLTNNKNAKTKKIKEGAIATVKLRGDTAKISVVMEAFLSDTIIVSLLKPQLTKKEINLEFAGFSLISIDDIESIGYSVRKRQLTYWTGFATFIVGFELALLPTIMPLIIGNADEIHSRPGFPITVGSGVILFFVGLKMIKSIKFREFNLDEWSYRVVKK